MRPLRVLSLFSGIGGLDLAAEWAGMQIIGQVEIDEYCRRVLARHWPRVKRVADVREVWGDAFGAVDVIVGGFPCQPFSVAGKQRGAADDRHLWPEMRRIIQVYQPAWIVGENVPGLIRLGLDAVFTDLAADGYEATAVVLPAAATGAPHLRERVFIVAHAVCRGRRQARQRGMGDALGEWRDTADNVPTPAHADTRMADAAARGMGRGRAQGSEGQPALSGEGVGPGAAHNLADTACQRHDGAGSAGQGRRSEDSDRRGDGQAVARRARPQEHVPAGPARQPGQAEPRLGRATDGIPAWLDGIRWPAGPRQEQHEWEAPRTTQERIPHRAARLKALGNAVVPQQAYPIFAAIAAVEAGRDGEGAA